MQQHDLFFMTTCTSLHAGTGKSEFSTIDHQVQRDYCGFPTILKSSMKGAIKEYCESSNMKEGWKQHIFGGSYAQNQRLMELIDTLAKENETWDGHTLEGIKEKLKEKTNRQTSAGRFSFYDAQLFSIPVRSNVRPFFNVTCPQILKNFKKSLKYFDLSEKVARPLEKELKELLDSSNESNNRIVLAKRDELVPEKGRGETMYLEEYTIQITDDREEGAFYPILSRWTDENLVIVSDKHFEDLTDDYHLPIVPRNVIENGLSKNLWYEQVVPTEARFYTFLGYPQKSEEEVGALRKELHEKTIAIGANQSVGYGRCWFESFKDLSEKK